MGRLHRRELLALAAGSSLEAASSGSVRADRSVMLPDRGEVVWRFSEFSNPIKTLNVKTGTVYATDRDQSTEIIGLDVETGAVKWRLDRPKPGMTIDGLVTTLGATPTLYGYDRQDGIVFSIDGATQGLNWVFDEPDGEIRYPAYPFSSPPEQRVLVRMRTKPVLYGIDPATGDWWRTSVFGGPIRDYPYSSGDELYLSDEAGDTLYALDGTTGDVRWRFAPPDGVPQPVNWIEVTDTAVYVAYNTAYKLDIETGSMVWDYGRSAVSIDYLRLQENDLYVGLNGTEVHRVAGESAEPNWTYEFTNANRINTNLYNTWKDAPSLLVRCQLFLETG